MPLSRKHAMFHKDIFNDLFLTKLCTLLPSWRKKIFHSKVNIQFLKS